MPLYSNAERVIRENLAQASKGVKPKPITIGCLSAEQLRVLNDQRQRSNLPPVNGLVFFRGTHVYDSRIVRDGYSIEDVVCQVKSAFSDRSIVRFTPKMTALQNPIPRDDGYGNSVKDECALECSARYPKAELFSVIPKGDRFKPTKVSNETAARCRAAVER